MSSQCHSKNDEGLNASYAIRIMSEWKLQADNCGTPK